jgi:hypothetical protein
MGRRFMIPRRRMFLGHPCWTWKLVVVVNAGGMKKGTPIPLYARIGGGMETKSLMTLAGWIVGRKILQQSTLEKHVVHHQKGGPTQVTGSPIMSNGERANGTRVGALITRRQKVCVTSGLTQAEMAACRIKAYLMLEIMGRMRRMGTTTGLGDQTLPKPGEGGSLLIT